MDECGHYSFLSGRLARFRAVQKARGMSESALARLPEVPHLPEPIVLRPVLATKHHAVNVAIQASQKARWIERGEKGQFKQVHSGRRPSWAKDPNRGNRLQRAKAIVEIVARTAGVEGYQMHASYLGQRFSIPREVAAYFLSMLVKAPGCVIADLFHYEDITSPKRMLYRVRRRLRNDDPVVTDLHDRALAAIKARWPEYADQ